MIKWIIPPTVKQSLTIRNMSTEAAEPRKAGVSSPSELQQFVSKAGPNILVVDARHPASVEPGDAKSLKVAGFPNKESNYRPNAINLPWNRESNSMELPEVDKDSTYIITHCGGGGRGQKAKDFLEKNGYKNVLNGGGPKETDCWAEYGDK